MSVNPINASGKYNYIPIDGDKEVHSMQEIASLMQFTTMVLDGKPEDQKKLVSIFDKIKSGDGSRFFDSFKLQKEAYSQVLMQIQDSKTPKDFDQVKAVVTKAFIGTAVTESIARKVVDDMGNSDDEDNWVDGKPKLEL